MSALLPDGPALLAFLAASAVLAATPGPGVVYIVTRSLTQGRRSGFASAAGVAVGNLGNAWGAALGLGAVFSVSALAFELVRWAGALYLLWLAWRLLQRRGAAAPDCPKGPAMPVAPWPRILRQGALVALFNPKTTVFFAAFLPQFVSAGASPVLQSMALGALFVAVAAVSDAVYVLAASRAAPWLARRTGAGRVGRWLGAGAMAGLGLYAAWSGNNGARR